MEHSTVKKWMIKHESEEDYKEFPCLPVLPIKGTRNLASAYAYRDFYGIWHGKLVASIPKVELEFENITDTKANILLVNYMDNFINSTGSKNFYLNINHPIHGWIKGLFTLGTPDTAEITYDLSNNQSNVLKDFELHFEAVKGFNLLDGDD